METENKAHIMALILLISVSIITMLILETRLTSWVPVQIAAILIAMFAALILFFGLWIDEPWAMPLSTVFFSAAIADQLWGFVITNAFTSFAFGVLVNVAGIILCIAGMQTSPKREEFNIETYEVEEAKKELQQNKKKKVKSKK